MDNTPISGLDELDKHLDELVQDPTNLTLTPKLFDDVELQLTETNIPSVIPRFLPRLTTLLQQYNKDPTPIVTLAIKLLGPISFTQILQLASEDSLIAALSSPFASQVNILALTILHKAAATPADAAILSVMPSLFSALITAWLSSPHVEVGQKALKVLGDLLDVDCPLPPPPPAPPAVSAGAGIITHHSELVIRKQPGNGALWDLLFNGRETYSLLLDLVSGRHANTASNPHQLSLAQGRVLRLLPRLACLNLQVISRSNFDAPAPAPVRFTNGVGGSSGSSGSSDHAAVSAPVPGEGLLQFAALRMVDKSDVLMHLSLVDFFEAFVSLMRLTEYSAFKVEVARSLLKEAVKNDEVLREALVTLPDRTVEEEAEGLRAWLTEIMPSPTTELPIRERTSTDLGPN